MNITHKAKLTEGEVSGQIIRMALPMFFGIIGMSIPAFIRVGQRGDQIGCKSGMLVFHDAILSRTLTNVFI